MWLNSRVVRRVVRGENLSAEAYLRAVFRPEWWDRRRLNHPSALAVDLSGALLVGDLGRRVVWRVDGRGRLTRLAGRGSLRAREDGGPAITGGFRWIMALAVAPDGGVYVADGHGRRVHKVSPDGTVRPFAGSGEPGHDGHGRPNGPSSTGDGGPAVLATFNFPAGLAIDASGAVIVSDCWDHRVRRVAPDGTITTVAGIGPSLPGVSPSQAGGFSGDGGPATAAALSRPWGVAFDNRGVLYVCDYHNQRLRAVYPDGTIATVASAAPLEGVARPANGPVAELQVQAAAADGQGNIFYGGGGMICRREPDGLSYPVLRTADLPVLRYRDVGAFTVDRRGTLYFVAGTPWGVYAIDGVGWDGTRLPADRG